MICAECGAELPGAESCLDRFHELLAAEVGNDELRRLHGLTVLTYHLQHPSLTRPWYQIWGRDMMRRIFGQGENWLEVLVEEHPRGVGRQRSAAALASRKAVGDAEMPAWVVATPVPGELTVASIDPVAAKDQTARIEAWARSVAEHRYLSRDA